MASDPPTQPSSPAGFRALDSMVVRFVVLSALDGTIAVASLWLGMLLRFEGHIENPYLDLLPWYSLLLVASRLTANWSMQLHRWSFRLSGLHDGARLVAATAIGSAVFVFAMYLLRVLSPPRSVVVFEFLATGAVMTALRFGPRLGWTYWVQLTRSRRGDSHRTLIVGAGAAGEMLCRDLHRSAEHRYNIIGFIDDDRSKWGKLVEGCRVIGSIELLPVAIKQFSISHLLIAVPRESASVVRQVVTACAGLDVQMKVLPVSYVYFQERGPANMLHGVSPEDLLAREAVIFAAHERSAIAGRRVLVTGAAGSIGSEICSQLLDLGVGELLGIDINENGLYLLEHRLRSRAPNRMTIQVVDIRDRGRVESVMRRFQPQDVFHAAAHKHVPLMEAAPAEAVKNNVIGTRHVVRAAERSGAECVVFISSDKAVAPSSVMGATKRIGELMTRAVARQSGLWGCAVRFGNVLGSDGSVVPLFRQQIQAGGPVTITHPDVRRYFMTIPEAVGLVLKASYGRFGDLCILDMGEPVRILDLANQMIAMAGLTPGVDIPVTFTGLRPGEKLDEELLTEDEEVTDRVEGKIQIVRGPLPHPGLWEIVADLERAASDENTDQVLALLKALVPTYRRQLGEHPVVASTS